MDLIERFKHARRVSAPVVLVTTADQQACIGRLAEAANGKGPAVLWDVVRGVSGLNLAGERTAKSFKEEGQDVTAGRPPSLFLAKIADRQVFTAGGVAFVPNADQWLKAQDAPDVLQGVCNLREVFKQDGRMLVLLATDLTLPAALKDDVVVLDDPLPGTEQLEQIVREIDEAASSARPSRKRLDASGMASMVEAVRGLSAFGAEQTAAMACRPDGFDLDHAWAAKIAEIEQTRGLTVHRGGATYADLGGLEPVKADLRAIVTGRKPVKLIVWLDEVEKTGLSSRQDTSGVSQDQEGTLLSFLEDEDVYGVMLLGVPGSGKSALCKAVGAEFDKVVIRLDLGAMMGSLVGQSQQQLRQALRVISAVGGKDTLWLATSNSIRGLSSAMKSRFTDVYFFDLPTPDERGPIWRVWTKKLGLADQDVPEDEGWVGRNIRQCAEKAWRTGCTLEEAAGRIVPVASTLREEIKALRTEADGRYLSASRPGVYRMDSGSEKKGRAITV